MTNTSVAISVPDEWRDRIAAIALLSAAIQNNITESGWSRGQCGMFNEI